MYTTAAGSQPVAVQVRTGGAQVHLNSGLRREPRVRLLPLSLLGTLVCQGGRDLPVADSEEKPILAFDSASANR